MNFVWILIFSVIFAVLAFYYLFSNKELKKMDANPTKEATKLTQTVVKKVQKKVQKFTDEEEDMVKKVMDYSQCDKPTALKTLRENGWNLIEALSKLN